MVRELYHKGYFTFKKQLVNDITWKAHPRPTSCLCQKFASSLTTWRRLLFPPPGFLFHPRVSLNAPKKKGRTTRAVFLHKFSTPYVEKWYGKRDTYFFKSTDYKSSAEKVRDTRSVLFLNRNRALTPSSHFNVSGFWKIRTLSKLISTFLER
jgi:hypothetical protein